MSISVFYGKYKKKLSPLAFRTVYRIKENIVVLYDFALSTKIGTDKISAFKYSEKYGNIYLGNIYS